MDSVVNEENCLFLDAVEDMSCLEIKESWVAGIKINGHVINFKLDTGTMANLISEEVLRSVQLNL